MDRAESMIAYWRRNGPPLPVAAVAIGQVLGIDWKAGRQEQSSPSEIAAGPTIAELAAMAPVPL